MASLNSYYTFYLIHKFNVSIQQSQLFLFVFLVATAIGTLMGGPIGDKIGRKYVIWGSILGTAPFSLLMPHAGLVWTIILSFCVGLMLSSAFPAILLYAQELLPKQVRTDFRTFSVLHLEWQALHLLFLAIWPISLGLMLYIMFVHLCRC